MSNPNSPYDPAGQPQNDQGYPQAPDRPGYESTRSAAQEPTQAYGAPAAEPMAYGGYDETQAYTPSAPQVNQTQPMPSYQEPQAAPFEGQQPRTSEFDGAAQAQPTQAFDYGQMPQSPYDAPAPAPAPVPAQQQGGGYPNGNEYAGGNGYAPANGYGQQPAAAYGGPGQVPPQIPPDADAPFNGQQPPKNSKTPIIIVSIIAAVLLIACIVFAVIALNKDDDGKPAESPSSTYSQTTSPKATDDPTDDPFDDPTDDPDEPLSGNSLGSDVLEQELRNGKTLEQAFSNPQVKKQLEEAIEQSSGDTEGMAFDVSAKGNTLVYAISFTDSSYDGYASIYTTMMDGLMCSPMSEFAKQLEAQYDLKDAKVEFILEDSTGKKLLDETYGPQSECKVTSEDYDSLLNND